MLANSLGTFGHCHHPHSPPGTWKIRLTQHLETTRLTHDEQVREESLPSYPQNWPGILTPSGCRNATSVLWLQSSHQTRTHHIEIKGKPGLHFCFGKRNSFLPHHLMSIHLCLWSCKSLPVLLGFPLCELLGPLTVPRCEHDYCKIRRLPPEGWTVGFKK